MPIIHKLSHHEAQKIAAGEVVERPASVVKELVENSIDAGATRITVTIEDGGKQLIACRDNGCGMDPVDARLCIERHATSKITTVDDLFNLNTFGFRGEALASLAAVSTLSITTKDSHHHEGLRITLNGTTAPHEEVVAHETGTLIEVKNLFHTVPARLKFLKKSDTEQRYIAQLFDALFLPHPEIHAKLIIDGSITKNYPATKTIHERAEQILIHKSNATLLPFTTTKNGIVLEGAISTHQSYRYDKSSLYIFVNRRWVKNIGLTRAIMRAYTALPEGKFPIVSLHISIDPTIIDVNIHPRKEEVAFTSGAPVESAITAALKATLEQELTFVTPAHSIYPHSMNAWSPTMEPHTFKPFNLSQPVSAPLDMQIKSTVPNTAPRSIQHENSHSSIVSHNDSLEQNKIQNDGQEKLPIDILGQIDNTYILARTSEGLTIVDQHAAHERILYEQFASRFGSIDTVHLLFPEIVHLSAADYELVLIYQELLAQHGVIAEPFGACQIRVTALPVFAKHISAQETLTSLVATLHECPPKADAHLFVTHALRAQMACKAAVKAGDSLTISHMEQLLRDLAKTPHKLTCPHGRPTYWIITIAELEKKFQRTA